MTEALKNLNRNLYRNLRDIEIKNRLRYVIFCSYATTHTPRANTARSCIILVRLYTYQVCFQNGIILLLSITT